jgi:hypothetical protein
MGGQIEYDFYVKGLLFAGAFLNTSRLDLEQIHALCKS